jgi:hypothetical protein
VATIPLSRATDSRISVDRAAGLLLSFAWDEIRENLCARCVQDIAVKGRHPDVTY